MWINPTCPRCLSRNIGNTTIELSGVEKIGIICYACRVVTLCNTYNETVEAWNKLDRKQAEIISLNPEFIKELIALKKKYSYEFILKYDWDGYTIEIKDNDGNTFDLSSISELIDQEISEG